MVGNLLKYSNGEIDMFYSRDIKEDFEIFSNLDLEVMAESITDSFLNLNKEYSDLVNLYAEENGLERIGILFAHGGDVGGKWNYYNEDKSFPIQSWINKMDGKYKALIMSSCNPGRLEINSQKSPVLVPNEVYSGALVNDGKVQTELFLPEIGYVDHYTIEDEMVRLRA